MTSWKDNLGNQKTNMGMFKFFSNKNSQRLVFLKTPWCMTKRILKCLLSFPTRDTSPTSHSYHPKNCDFPRGYFKFSLWRYLWISLIALEWILVICPIMMLNTGIDICIYNNYMFKIRAKLRKWENKRAQARVWVEEKERGRREMRLQMVKFSVLME